MTYKSGFFQLQQFPKAKFDSMSNIILILFRQIDEKLLLLMIQIFIVPEIPKLSFASILIFKVEQYESSAPKLSCKNIIVQQNITWTNNFNLCT